MFGRKTKDTTTALWPDKPEPEPVKEHYGQQAPTSMYGANAKATEDPLGSIKHRLERLEYDSTVHGRNDLQNAHQLSNIEKHLAGIYLHLGIHRVEITENIYDELMRLATETRVELRKIAPAKKG